jgi:hypothetical protein
MVRNTLLVLAGAAMLAVGAMSSTASAAVVYGIADGAIPLSNLVGTGNSLLVGDKIFDNFQYTKTGDMPTANSINVTGRVTTINGVPEWGFRMQGAFHDFNTTGGSDALLTYDVHVTDPNVSLIADAYIAGNPLVIGQGEMTVTETFLPLAGAPINAIYNIDAANTQLQNTVFFNPPTPGLSAQKDILAAVPDGLSGNAASLSFIDQLYSQVPAGGGTPEPASIGLLAIGAMGLLARRRR